MPSHYQLLLLYAKSLAKGLRGRIIIKFHCREGNNNIQPIIIKIWASENLTPQNLILHSLSRLNI